MNSCATAHRRGRHKECVVGTEINRFLSPGRGAETESAGVAAAGEQVNCDQELVLPPAVASAALPPPPPRP